MISSRSAYGKTISCDYGGAALASAGGASAGGQEGFVASGEVEDGTGELDLTCHSGSAARSCPARVRASAIMSASLTTRRSFRLDLPPDWASPSTSPARGIPSRLGRFRHRRASGESLRAVARPGAGFRTGNKERPRVGAATPHAAAQLMQLREAVSVGIKDDDAAGLFDVHADFDHRGGHQDLESRRRQNRP